jgi:hypothetical protein
MKKFKWAELTKGLVINKRITRDKNTKEVLLGVNDFACGNYLAYSKNFDSCGIYLASELEVQQEVDFDLRPFDHTKCLDFDCEVVNRNGDVVNKQDLLIGEDRVCYKLAGLIYAVYVNGRQNIQEHHFSDLLLRVEV